MLIWHNIFLPCRRTTSIDGELYRLRLTSPVITDTPIKKFVRPILSPLRAILVEGRLRVDQVVKNCDRGAALLQLTADQQKRLAAYATIAAINTGESAEDFLQAANVRWLASNVPVEGPEKTLSFLYGTIKGLRSNIFRHKKIATRVDGIRIYATTEDDTDPMELAPDASLAQDDSIYVQEVYSFCATDDEVQTFILLDADGASREEIKLETGWNDKKYEAVRKRKIRMIARMKSRENCHE